MSGLLRLKPLTAPTDEPVTIAEAKLHARIDDDIDNALVASLIKTAREMAEAYTRRAFITQTWQLFMDAFPAESFIDLPRPPLVSVAHVKTYTDADVAATMSASDYYVDTVSEPARLVLRDGKSWPDVGRVANGVEIQFTAGYGGPDVVPGSIKTGALHLVAWLYEHRGDAGQMPPDSAYQALVADRIWHV